MDKKLSSTYEKPTQKQSRTRDTKAPPMPQRSEEISSDTSENGRDRQTAEFHIRIAQKAYELFERRGGGSGGDVNDWLEAERLVRDEMRLGEK